MGGILGLPSWLLGLTLASIIPAGWPCSQRTCSVCTWGLGWMYQGLGWMYRWWLVPKASGCISGTIKNKSTQEKRPCSSCSETEETQGMCEHLAEALDLDRGLRKGEAPTGWPGQGGRRLRAHVLAPPGGPGSCADPPLQQGSVLLGH